MKAEPVVQRDAGRLVRIDACNNGVMPQGPGAENQLIQEKGTDAAPMLLMMGIERVLNCPPIGGARVVG